MLDSISEFDTQIISLILGVAIAQGVNIANDKYRKTKLKQALLDELKQLKEEIHIAQISLERGIQILSLDGIEANSHVTIEGHIFNNHYKDVVIDLNKEQRISYQMIHSLLSMLNSALKTKASIAERAAEKEEKAPYDLKKWGESTLAAYRTARQLLWHIEFHVTNEKSPKLDYGGPVHESYLKFLENINNEIEQIVKSGETCERGSFDKIYDEESFKGGYGNTREE